MSHDGPGHQEHPANTVRRDSKGYSLNGRYCGGAVIVSESGGDGN